MIPAVSNATTNAMKTYQDANYPNIIVAESEIKDLTGYRIRKCLSYDQKQYVSGQAQSTTGCVIFRAVEAYLNYMEAACMKNNGMLREKLPNIGELYAYVQELIRTSLKPLPQQT